MPVERIPGYEWFQVSMSVPETKATQIGPRNVPVMAQHPDCRGTTGGFKQLSGPVAFHEGLDCDHLKRQGPNTAKHDAVFLPFGLVWGVTYKAAIMLLHD